MTKNPKRQEAARKAAKKNKWIAEVKSFAKEHKISYKQGLIQIKSKGQKKPGVEMENKRKASLHGSAPIKYKTKNITLFADEIERSKTTLRSISNKTKNKNPSQKLKEKVSEYKQ
jgi:hypothetical protein